MRETTEKNFEHISIDKMLENMDKKGIPREHLLGETLGRISSPIQEHDTPEYNAEETDI